MSSTAGLHAQLASIMEVLANAAVLEICGLVDRGYAALQGEISRGHKENEALRRRLRTMELRVARTSAMRSAGIGGSVFSRARAQNNELKRTHTVTAEAQLLRITARVTNCGDAELSGDTGQDGPGGTTQRKCEPAAGEEVKPKAPLIKEEKVEEVEEVEEVWADSQQDKGFHRGDEDLREDLVEEDVLSVSKREAGEQEGGSCTSCTWASGDIPDTGLASVPERSEGGPGLAEAAGYDCMIYEPQNPPDHDPADPGCSYGSAPSDSGSGFPFAISDVSRSVAEHPQAAAFTDNRQRAPLPAAETQMAARKDIQAVPGAFVMRDDWAPRDGYDNGAGFTRDDPGGKAFICSFCGKTLACLKNLKTHMRVHTGEKPFSCPLCGKRFSDSSNLKRHQSVHTGEKRYGCVHCGKRFAQSGSLKVHMSVHSGCKQFKCPHCGKTFISAIHLRRHISIHEGEKRLSATFQ